MIFLRYPVVVLCCLLSHVFAATDPAPAATYDGGYNKTTSGTILRIGNGGAGQSGLIKVLADAFIQHLVASGQSAIKVEWYESDTTATINYLASGVIDVGITYSTAAESVAIKQGVAVAPSYYVFRDHFLLVGPLSNPANISTSNGTDNDVSTIFSTLLKAAGAAATDPPVRFLSRYDKSATNIKESMLWLSIGQAPWAVPFSTFYHQYIAFPHQALVAAMLLQEYTLTDRGTFLSLPTIYQSLLTIYKAGSDSEDDPLLLPAHLLVGTKAANMTLAVIFADWVVSKEGQSAVTGFDKGGMQLYSGAP